MKLVKDLNNEDYIVIAESAIKLAKSKKEEDIYLTIGNGLYDYGLDLARTGDSFFKSNSIKDGKLLPLKAYSYLTDSEPLGSTEAARNGEKFFKKLNEKVRKIICNDTKIISFINGSGGYTLKDVLIVVVPLIITALGLTVINPVLLGIIVAAIAIICKIGFNVYCSWEK